MPGSHHHRSGGLRQTNKKNKRSTASKRSLSRKLAGRVNRGGASIRSTSSISSKADRRNHQQQKRDAKRQELLRKKRGLDGLAAAASAAPPRVIGIVSLSEDSAALEERVREYILSGADRVVQTETGGTMCKFNVHKRDGVLTILTGAGSAFGGGDDCDPVLAALDLARVCDSLLFVIDGNAPAETNSITEIQIGSGGGGSSSVFTHKTSGTQQQQDLWDHLISERGDRILAAVKGQGLPTPVTVLAHTVSDDNDGVDDDHMTMQSVKSIRRSKLKRRLDLKKYVSRFATTEFGNDHNKVVEIDLTTTSTTTATGRDAVMQDNDNDDTLARDNAIKSASAALVRTLCSMSCSPAKWIANVPRSFVLTDCWRYDAANQELHLTGYVRGMAPLDVNALVHVPGVGTYACKLVEQAIPPLLARTTTRMMMMMADKEDAADVVRSNPELRESLNMFADPDALEGEQNLIGFDDDQDFEDADDRQAFERPAGWSDYQSAWLDAVDDKEDAFERAVNNDHGELAEELNQKKDSAISSIATGDVMDLDEANDVTAEERRALAEQRKKQQSEENEFPDEVQVDEDANAAERFARYRSLKSFRKSHWDPKENLPESFASIYHFTNFKQTQRSVMNDMKDLVREAEAVGGNFWGKSPSKTVDSNAMNDEEIDDGEDFLEGCIPSGSYVTLILEAVPADAMDSVSQYALLTAVSLLAHENKVSVLHMGLSQSSKCDSTDDEFPIKSKDVLTFRCGWRTWKARPVFSQNNLNCDKHKFERFLPTGGAFFAASVFGPVTYTPCPVLVFRENNTKRELVAVGSMIGADADRIVVKRIILTGYPVRVHKRTATVKYMFYNPEDVKWFKPAGLHTKHGLQGNIVQSVGEHGTMKCLFNAPIKQHDTVCLPLYKRIYPKFVQGDSVTSRKDWSLVVR